MRVRDAVLTISVFLAGFTVGFIMDHFTIWVGPKPWPFG